jgi:nitrogen fixation protein NifB
MKLQQHPCFSTHCRPSTGRIHLPVSPWCNIFCRFCTRGLTADVDRPGNAERLLSPEDALPVVDTALRLCPEIRVAGVAGPGDPLAGPEALEALSSVKREHPGIICCLSTNGLMLEESMEGILSAGVESLTVTINALDPEILLKINRGALIGGEFIGGLKGQEILIRAQERGLRLAKRSSLIIKVNSVLIPGVNDGHIPHVAQRAREWGADLLNIIPLIPAGELSDLRAPTASEYSSACEKAERFLPVKSNCRRCRADACGVPGLSDFSRDVYGRLSFTETFSHG